MSRSDSGYCAHGEIYDPVKRVCRSIFCQEGYDFSSNACVRDNSTIDYETSTSKCPEEMIIEFTLNNKFCVKYTITNEKVQCNSELIHNHVNLMDNLQELLSKLLIVNRNRIENIKLVCNTFYTR